jgi:hypothetical protein
MYFTDDSLRRVEAGRPAELGQRPRGTGGPEHRVEAGMAESGTRRQALAAQESTERPWAPVVMVVVVVAAFVVGCRTGRGWGRLTGW